METEGGESAVDRRKLVAYYEARAASYDAGKAATWGSEEGFSPDVIEQLVGWAKVGVMATRKFALDCACGTGRVVGALVKEGLPTIGVDLTPAMLKRAVAKHRAPPGCMFAQAATERLPFRDRFFGAVLDVSAFHHYADPEAIAAEWARVLAPGGRLVFADVVEKDQDEAGFLSSLEHAMRPGTVHVYYKPHEIAYFLENAGLLIESSSFYRLKKKFERLDADKCAPAGTDPAGWRSLLAAAPDEVKELYEVNEEGMVWRFLALTARKP